MVVNKRNTKDEIYDELKKAERKIAKMEGRPEERGRGRPKGEPITDPETSEEIAQVTQNFIANIQESREVIGEVAGPLYFHPRRKDAKITPEVWEFMEYWWSMGATDEEVKSKIGVSKRTWERFFKQHPHLMERKNLIKKTPSLVADENITLALFKERKDLISGAIKKPEISMWKAERDSNLKHKYQKTQHVVKDTYEYKVPETSRAKIANIFNVEIPKPEEVEMIDETGVDKKTT